VKSARWAKRRWKSRRCRWALHRWAACITIFPRQTRKRRGCRVAKRHPFFSIPAALRPHESRHRLGDALRRYPREDYELSTKVGRRFVPRTTPYDGSEGWSDPLPFQAIFDSPTTAFFDRSRTASNAWYRRYRYCADPRISAGHTWRKQCAYWRTIERGGFRALDELRASRGVKAVGLGVNEGAAIQEVMAEYNIDCALLAGRYTLLEQRYLTICCPNARSAGQHCPRWRVQFRHSRAGTEVRDSAKGGQPKVQLWRCARR